MVSVFELEMFQRVTSWIEFCELCRILNYKTYNVSSFDIKNLQSVRFELEITPRVRFWNKNLTRCEIGILKFQNLSKFDLKFLHCLRSFIKKLHLFWWQSCLAAPHIVPQSLPACHHKQTQPTKFRQLDSGIRRSYNSLVSTSWRLRFPIPKAKFRFIGEIVVNSERFFDFWFCAQNSSF